MQGSNKLVYAAPNAHLLNMAGLNFVIHRFGAEISRLDQTQALRRMCRETCISLAYIATVGTQCHLSC